MNEIQDQYGPSCKEVQAALNVLGQSPTFAMLGRPHADDKEVKRVYDWAGFRELADYVLIEEAGPHNCEYLRFLALCSSVSSELSDLIDPNGLRQEWRNANNDACELDDSVTIEESTEYKDFVWSYSDDENPYNYWRFSIEDHGGYLITESIVSHLTECNFFRYIWKWYAARHWPCGWEGDWPDGRLIVF